MEEGYRYLEFKSCVLIIRGRGRTWCHENLQFACNSMQIKKKKKEKKNQNFQTFNYMY